MVGIIGLNKTINKLKSFMFGDIIGKGNEWKKMPFFILKDNPKELLDNMETLILILESRMGTNEYTPLFVYSFKYLMSNPQRYDGASGDQELDIITIEKNNNTVVLRYDINSIIHDALDAVGFTQNYNSMQISNSLFDKMNILSGVSEFNLYKRKLVSLPIVTRFRIFMRKKNKPNIIPTNLAELVYKLNDNHKVNLRPLYIGTLILISTLVGLYFI